MMRAIVVNVVVVMALSVAAMAAPSSIAEYRAIFREQTEAIDDSFEKECAEALDRYGVLLKASDGRLRASGDPEAVLAGQRELRRFEAEKTIPPDTPVTFPLLLIRARADYHEAIATAEKVRNRRKQILLGRQYIPALKRFMAALTRESKLEEALAVKPEISRAEYALAELQIAGARESEEEKAYGPRDGNPKVMVYTGVDLSARPIYESQWESDLAAEWPTNSPAPGVKDNFSVVIEGSLKVPQNGEYVFYGIHDDEICLQVTDRSFGFGAANSSLHELGIVQMEKGWQDFRVAVHDRGGMSRLDIRWSGPGMALQRITADNMAEPSGTGLAPPTGPIAEKRLPGTRVYAGHDWSGSPQHEFLWVGDLKRNWGCFGPVDGLYDQFTVQIDGTLKVPVTGRYSFCAQHDDQIILWIDNRAIGSLPGSGALERLGEADLTMGNHKFRMVIQDGRGASSFDLQWQGPDTQLRTISETDIAGR